MKIAIYTRVSTSDQSVEAQMMELKAFTKAKGWEVAQEFTDVMSGAKKDRPGLDALMAQVRACAIDTILCVKLDRMARSLRNFAEMVEEFDRLGVALICTSQGIDTSKNNACGRLQMQVLAAVAQFERSLIRERTCAGLAVAVANGKKLGRPSKLLPQVAARGAILAQWRAEGGKNYRKLGQMLGGVSAATAWRLAWRCGKTVAPAAAAVTMMEVDV